MDERRDKLIVRRVFETCLSGLREDPGLVRCVLDIAHGKDEKNVKRTGKRSSRFAAAVVVAALVFATAAFALARPAVLNWLTGNAPVSLQLESTAQMVMGENTAEGITVRMTGIVYDGEKLVFAYELENDRPAMPVLVAAEPMMSVDGKEVQMLYCTADLFTPQMVPSPHLDVLPVRRNPAVGGGVAYVRDIAQGEVACEITFVVYKPENQFAVILEPGSMQANVEACTGDARAEAEDSLNTLQSFRNAVFATEEDLANERWLAEKYTVIDGSGNLYDLPENSHLTEIARIRVSFGFDASVAFACDFDGTDDVVLADAVLHVEEFRLSSLETHVDLWLNPQENTREDAQALAARYGAYALVDGQGGPVQYSEMDYMADPAPWVTQIGGQWVCRYRSEMPGLLRFPDRVGFMAGGEELIWFDLDAGE